MQPPQSLWWATRDADDTVIRPALSTALDVDVAIVGGGFTGLWTARELLEREPSLRVVIIESEVCGFGASGRNGGWASALFPVSDDALAKAFGDETVTHLHHHLNAAVTDLGAAFARDGIDAHYVAGGTYTFATTAPQEHRLRAASLVAADRGFGDEAQWFDTVEVAERAVVANSRGALFTPHCARIHPAKAVRGLARAVEDAGATIFEHSRVTRIEPGTHRRRPRVVTVGGTVTADFVVRATEAFTTQLPGERRTVAPIYSLMIATEPQSEEFWLRHGFADRATFADDRHLIIYGQRTDDGRIAFGGRGAPYHFGSSVEPRFDRSPRVVELLLHTLREFFPDLEGSIDYAWGGPLGMPRDLMPSVWVDYESGMAAAGGYTGDGVVLSYVAGRTLSQLLTTPSTPSGDTILPFVQRRSRKWEPEPLRYAGINAGLALASWSDFTESRLAKESRASGLLDRLFDQFPP